MCTALQMQVVCASVPPPPYMLARHAPRLVQVHSQVVIAPVGTTHQPSAGMRWTRVGGRAPLWGDKLDSDKAGLWRYLFFPLLVYQFVCYTCRCACSSNSACKCWLAATARLWIDSVI